MNMREGGNGGTRAGTRPGDAPRSGGALLRNSVLVVIGVGVCALLVVWLLRAPAESPPPSGGAAIQSLQSGDPATRVQAIREVAQTGLSESERSIPAVMQALRDKEPLVRAQAAESLGLLGSYAVWAQISGVAAGDSDGGLVDGATEALLSLLAKDDEGTVRASCAAALGNIAATSPRPPRSRGASRKGGGGNSSKAPAPVKSPVEYKPIVDALIAALGDSDDDVRSAAATALGSAGPKVSPEPPPQLIAALKDRTAVVRAQAGKALPSFERGLDPVVPTLIRLAAENDPTVRQASVGALGQIKKSALSPAAIPALVEGIGSPDRQVRMHVIAMLARFGSQAKDAVPRLIGVLDEPLSSDSTTLEGGRSAQTTFTGPAHEAAKALGEIVPGSPLAEQAVAALSRVVRGAARQRRSSAADALGKFGAAAAPAITGLVKMLLESADGTTMTATSDADAARRALSSIAADASSSKTVVSALKASLVSGSNSSRIAVVEAIEELGPKAAGAAPEIEALKNDPDPEVQKAATKALKALGQK